MSDDLFYLRCALNWELHIYSLAIAHGATWLHAERERVIERLRGLD